LIFVHSHDATTEFLEEIIHFLIGKGYDNFEHIKILEGSGGGEEARAKIAGSPPGSTIVFLGHGASHCIYMPYSGDRAAEVLINRSNFNILHGKNLICLACRSAEFIRKNYAQAGQASMLGFEDLPTHWQDIATVRELDCWNAYSDITDDVLAKFREILVQVFADALYDAVANNLDFHHFYLRLRLYTNRWMYKVPLYSITGNPTMLANILYELKTGIQLVGNPDVTLI
jgi:hypothetical protein